MKVLVATALTQGQRYNDYFHSVEGELVFILRPCARDVMTPDGPCGCGRAFAGLVSAKATTTARVAELPDVGRSEYIEALRTGLEEQGHPGYWAEGMADDLTELILPWPGGTIIERRLDQFYPRSVVLMAEAAGPPDLSGWNQVAAEPPAFDPDGCLAMGPPQQSGTSVRPASAGAGRRPPKRPAAIPSLALARINAMLEAKSSSEKDSLEKDRMYLDLIVDGRDVTIMQHWARISLQPERHDAWLAKSVARLRYLKSRGVWQLFWGEYKGRWTSYSYLQQSDDIQQLLDEIRLDDHHLFWS